MKLPRAILFDLDDTILVAFGLARSQWQRTISAFADQLGPIEAAAIAAAVEAASGELWSDPARHKYWRHRTGAARRRIVATAFAALATAGHPVPPGEIGDALADAYNALHDEELSLFPEAHETLDRLKDLGVKLALITNGAAEPQRAKVVRFALEHRFDHIQIEGEHGFGKPEERAGTAASAQTGPSVGYDRAALTEAICRQYAAAQRGMPYETMYGQCMYARGYRVPGFTASPNSPGYQGELPGPATYNGGA